VVECLLILPSRKRVRVIGQKQFGFGVVVFTRPSKNQVKRELLPRQVLEDVSAKVGSKIVFFARLAERHPLGCRWDGRAEENLMVGQNQTKIRTTAHKGNDVHVRCSRILLSIVPPTTSPSSHKRPHTDQKHEGGW
jgi:hypothetical protein